MIFLAKPVFALLAAAVSVTASAIPVGEHAVLDGRAAPGVPGKDYKLFKEIQLNYTQGTLDTNTTGVQYIKLLNPTNGSVVIKKLDIMAIARSDGKTVAIVGPNILGKPRGIPAKSNPTIKPGTYVKLPVGAYNFLDYVNDGFDVKYNATGTVTYQGATRPFSVKNIVQKNVTFTYYIDLGASQR